MKTSVLRPILATFVLFSVLNLQPSTFAQTTAFTYQGRLNDGPTAANGLYDMTFSVFGVTSGGSVVAAPLTNSAVAVSNGLFTTQLDFGAAIFDGNVLFLEIGVRSTGGGPFTTLAPRQTISPAPYAIFADSAITAHTVGTGAAVTRLNNLQDNVTLAAGANVTITPSGNTLTIGASGVSPWLLNATNTFYNGGNVGIGTSVPNAPLHIANAVPVLALQDSDSTTAQVGLVSFRNSTGFEGGWLGFGSSGNAHATFMNNRSGGNTGLGAGGLERLTVTPGGNVGVGTTSPQTRLDVRGDVKLGNSGQLFASGGEENLRIVRGTIGVNGNIIAGSGFQVSHTVTGEYIITFNTPFTGRPSSTATATSDVNIIANVVSSTNQLTVDLWSTALDSLESTQFEFIAIGPR